MITIDTRTLHLSLQTELAPHQTSVRPATPASLHWPVIRGEGRLLLPLFLLLALDPGSKDGEEQVSTWQTPQPPTLRCQAGEQTIPPSFLQVLESQCLCLSRLLQQSSTDWVAYTQQEFISYSSGGQKSETAGLVR